ncbi:MAG TPA: HD domain-containing protein [Gemmatimonadaceae bacterium]
MTGYSDRINHALAFAAKHHDQQVRRGTRPPYFTQPANLAVMLTRYGRAEECVTAGILLEVVEDYSREGHPRDWMQQRIGEKFGADALDIALMAGERRTDDGGTEMTSDERRADLLSRLSGATDDARWLVAADALHSAGSLLADLRRTVEANSVWRRLSLGREKTVGGYRRIHDRLADLGFDAPILTELDATVRALEGHAD